MDVSEHGASTRFAFDYDGDGLARGDPGMIYTDDMVLKVTVDGKEMRAGERIAISKAIVEAAKKIQEAK
jgi:hypothetical protein